MNLLPTFTYEQELWNSGHKIVVGIDEVGRGAFAGPLVVAAVTFKPFSSPILGINDSKKLSLQKREQLSPQILQQAQCYSIIEIPVEYINDYGMTRALHKGYKEAIDTLPVVYDHILIDGYQTPVFPQNKQIGVIKGDSLSVSIAAASIIAKVYRDNLMTKLHSDSPHYSFVKNKGYGTRAHREAIKEIGISQAHRIQFCKNYNSD